MSKYQVIDGTSYHETTSIEVIRILERARLSKTRLHISFGETDGEKAGLDWLEENDVYGFIGRSMGPVKIPLLIHSRRSLGGPGLLDHCIVRIRLSAGGKVIYQHSKYHHDDLEIRPKSDSVELADGRKLMVDVLRNGTIHASFETVSKARKYIHKLGVHALIAG